jgi:hypothetical protein
MSMGVLYYVYELQQKFVITGIHNTRKNKATTKFHYSTNAFLKTTVRNNVSVLHFIVHYLLHVSAPIGGHLQVKCT